MGLSLNKHSLAVLSGLKIFLDSLHFTSFPIYIRPLRWFENSRDTHPVDLHDYIMFIAFKRLSVHYISKSHIKLVKTFFKHFKLAKPVSKRDALQKIASWNLFHNDNLVNNGQYGANVIMCLSDCMERFIALRHSKTELEVLNLDDGNNEESYVSPEKENIDHVPPMPLIEKSHRLVVDANKFLN